MTAAINNPILTRLQSNNSSATSERPRRSLTREPSSRKRVLPSEPVFVKRATTQTSGTGFQVPHQPPPAYPSLTASSQTQQRRKAPLSVYPRRAYSLRSDRMSQATGLPSLCRQASGLPRNHAAARREPRSPYPCHKLLVQVFDSLLLPSLCLLADMCPVTSSTPISTSSVSPSALSATSPRSKCRAICSQISKPSSPAPIHTFDEKQPFAP